MQKFKIVTTFEFDRDFRKLDKPIQEQIRAEISQLQENPFVGKPLSYPFFREKKAKHLRFYYLVYESLVTVFVIAISDKKTQQDTINKIKQFLPHYEQELKRLLG